MYRSSISPAAGTSIYHYANLAHEPSTLQALRDAVEKHDLNRLVHMLKQLSPDAPVVMDADSGRDGKTLLHVAAALGDEDAVLALLPSFVKQPDRLNAKDQNSCNALLSAAEGGNINVVKSLIDAGLSGLDALERTVSDRNVEATKVLISAGVNPMSFGRNSDEAANPSASVTQDCKKLLDGAGIDMVTLLFAANSLASVKEGEHVVKQEAGGSNSLLIAWHNGDMDSVGAMVDDGARLPADLIVNSSLEKLKSLTSSENGAARLDSLIQMGGTRMKTLPLRVVAANDMPFLRQILAHGVGDLEGRDEEGFTALGVASRDGNVEAIKVLCAAGANVNATQTYGFRTALFIAAEQNKPDAINALCQYGANIEARAMQSRTALMHAIEMRNPQAINALLAKGANPNHSAWDRVTPLKMAVAQGDLDTVQALHEHGAHSDVVDDD